MTETAASTTAPRPSAPRRRGLGARRGLVGAAVLAVALSGVGAACGSSSDDASSDTTSAGASGTVPANETTVSTGGSSSGGGSNGSSSGGSSNGGSSGGGSSTTKPVINSFTTPENIDCHNGNFQEFTASWSTTGATRVTISIDGPGVYKEYGPSGSDSLPFNCSSAHTFLLTAYSADGGTTTKQITLQPRNAQGQGSGDDSDDTQP
jgi:hypothetical protein